MLIGKIAYHKQIPNIDVFCLRLSLCYIMRINKVYHAIKMKCVSDMRVRQRLKQLNIQYFAISQVVLLSILLFNCVNYFSYTTNQINSITEKVEHFETNIKSMRNSIKDLKITLKEATDEFKSSLRSIEESSLRLKSIETEVIGINEKLARITSELNKVTNLK